MPVRKVSNRGGNIIGRFPSLKLGRMIDFESLIERDFIYLLDFEQDVTSFTEQPLTIAYEYEDKVLHYTPDFYITRNDRHILVECKPEKRVNLAENQRKFAAAQAWCGTRGWEFQVVTDDQLRHGHRLANIRLLTQFARYNISVETKNRIRACLSAASATITIADLMVNVHPQQPHLVKIPIYHMAFHHELTLDLDDAPLSLNSPVSLARRGA
jgi:hypothetical protein